MKAKVEAAYRLLIRVASSLQSPFLLAVRLYWGWQFVQTGWGKLHNLDKVTDLFTSLSIPAPAVSAVLISSLEFGGGILLAVGLCSRLVALLLSANMLTAFLTADRDAFFSIFTDPDKLYMAAPYTYLFASLIVLIFGPGKWCLDAAIERKWFHSSKAL